MNCNSTKILEIIQILQKSEGSMQKTMIQQIIDEFGKDPFLILIACLLSLRTKDQLTTHISRKLFSFAKTPKETLKIPIKELEKIIYPVGFYKRKSRLLHEVSNIIIEKFNGKVPSDFDQLLSIKGVGRKTANLVLSQAFDIPAICVDTHVHRISNRLGIIKTTNPLQTELELKKIIPKKYWASFNNLLVVWGQNICVPISPFCSKCSIYNFCNRVGVKKRR